MMSVPKVAPCERFSFCFLDPVGRLSYWIEISCGDEAHTKQVYSTRQMPISNLARFGGKEGVGNSPDRLSDLGRDMPHMQTLHRQYCVGRLPPMRK